MLFYIKNVLNYFKFRKIVKKHIFATEFAKKFNIQFGWFLQFGVILSLKKNDIQGMDDYYKKYFIFNYLKDFFDYLELCELGNYATLEIKELYEYHNPELNSYIYSIEIYPLNLKYILKTTIKIFILLIFILILLIIFL